MKFIITARPTLLATLTFLLTISLSQGLVIKDRESIIPETITQTEEEKTQAEQLYQDGIAELTNKEYDKAFENFKKAVDLKHTDAHYELAKCYAKGWGTKPDVSKALPLLDWHARQTNQLQDLLNHQSNLTINYYAKFAKFMGSRDNYQNERETGSRLAGTLFLKEASELGHPVFQYLHGSRNHRNTKKNLYWITKSADQNFAPAMSLIIGYYYNESSYFKSKYSKVIPYWKKLAERDDPTACYKLGLCYLNGLSVQKNPEEAFKWFERSSKTRSIDSRSLFELYK